MNHEWPILGPDGGKQKTQRLETIKPVLVTASRACLLHLEPIIIALFRPSSCLLQLFGGFEGLHQLDLRFSVTMARYSTSIINESYLSSIMSESPSIRSSTSKYARRFPPSSRLNDVFEMSSTTMSSFGPATHSLLPQDTSCIIQEKDREPEDQTLSTLFIQFFEGQKKFPLHSDVLDISKEHEDICCDHLSVIDTFRQKKGRKIGSDSRTERMLRMERNSWRLARILYEDRIRIGKNELILKC